MAGENNVVEIRLRSVDEFTEAFDAAVKSLGDLRHATDVAAAGFDVVAINEFVQALTDAQGHAALLSETLRDPTNAVSQLEQAGIHFTDSQRDQITTLLDSGKTIEAQAIIVAELQKQLKGAGEATNEFADSQKKAGEESSRLTDGLAQRFGGLRHIIEGAFAGLSIHAFLKVNEEAQLATVRLDAAFKGAEGTIGLTRDRLTELSHELQHTTTFSHDTVQSAEALLLTFNKVRGEGFERTIKAAADLSILTGRDLPQTVRILGRALQDPERGMEALRRSQIALSVEQRATIKNFLDQGKSAAAQNALLEIVEGKVKGLAAAYRNTLGGALTALGNDFKELFEQSSDKTSGLADSVTHLGETLRDPAIKQGVADLAAGFFKLAEVIAHIIGLIPDFVRGMAEGLAHLLHGADTQLGQFQDRLDAIDARLKQRFVPEAEARQLLTERAKVLAQIEQLQREELKLQNIRGARGQTPGAPPGGIPGAVAGFDETEVNPEAVEKVNELIASLKQKIIADRQGEVATLAYRIAQGDLAKTFAQTGDQAGPLRSKIIQLTSAIEALKLTKMSEDLRQQVATFQASGFEVLKYRLEVGDLSKVLKDAGAAGKTLRAELEAQQLALERLQVAAQLKEINAQIEDLRGNTDEAVKIRFEIETDALRKQLEDIGDFAGKQLLDSRERLAIDEARFNKLREEGGRITEKLAIQEERIHNSQEVGAISELDALHELEDARREALRQLTDIEGKMKDISSSGANEKLVRDTERFGAELEKLAASVNLVAKKFQSIFKESFTDALAEILTFTGSTRKAFSNMFARLRDELARFLAGELVQKFFKMLSSSLGGSSVAKSGGFLGAIVGGLGALFGGSAGGGRYSGLQLVGENGPELVGSGINQGQAWNRSQLAFMGGGGGSLNYAPVNNINIVAKDTDANTLRREFAAMLAINNEKQQRELAYRMNRNKMVLR